MPDQIMNKSLWMLLFLWFLITALTEMDRSQDPPARQAGQRLARPGQPGAPPGLAYNRNNRVPARDLKTN